MWGIWYEIMNSSVQSDICFVTELLNLVYRLNVLYSNPWFFNTLFMQEYPIDKHEITIIVNHYLVKGDRFKGDVDRSSADVYNRAGDNTGDSLSRIN
jgi:hypothetical protein